MFESIAVRISQGTQVIPDPRRAEPKGFRGRPAIEAGPCEPACGACAEACPTGAVLTGPLRVDLGRCVQCGDCASACSGGRLTMSGDFRLATTTRDGLVLDASRPAPDPVRVSAELKKRFGRSLKLRSVSAGGCNACELELNATTNVNFDIGRYGIDIVASPRHADGLVLTGPITRNMAQALQLAWDGMPDPKIVIAVGACAISGGPYADSPALDRAFLERFQPTLYVPGCPPHPLSIVCGLLDLLGIES